ncbi:DNA polymerase III subunit psi [Shigella flexneri]
MTSRRDWQLQQLGITQWSLRRPGALQGEIAISIPAHVRLVMVAARVTRANRTIDERYFTRINRQPGLGFTTDA